MGGVGGETVAGEHLLRGRFSVSRGEHEARPSRKRPTRRSEMDRRGQGSAEASHVIGHAGRVNRVGIAEQ